MFIGSCNKPGCHFALVVLDTVTKKLTYADSLAWKPPTNLIDLLENFLDYCVQEKILSSLLLNVILQCQEMLVMFAIIIVRLPIRCKRMV